MNFVNMGSIVKFRDIVQKIKRNAHFVSYNEETNEVTLDESRELPILDVNYTEKIHGTNAGFQYNGSDVMYQSRKKEITIENDNAGCAYFLNQRVDVLKDMVHNIANKNNLVLDENYSIVLFGEFCGGNIQRKTAVDGLDKMFIMFKYCRYIDYSDPENITITLYENTEESKENDIHNIQFFPKASGTIKVNFNKPDEALKLMESMVEEVEKSSYAGESFGIQNNIGEGFVFDTIYQDEILFWKVKGEEHSKSPVKRKRVKSELPKEVLEFVNYIACAEFRLDQMYNETRLEAENVNDCLSTKYIGNYLKKVTQDVWKEELDKAQEMIPDLEPKKLNGLISKVAKSYFIDKLNQNL